MSSSVFKFHKNTNALPGGKPGAGFGKNQIRCVESRPITSRYRMIPNENQPADEIGRAIRNGIGAVAKLTSNKRCPMKSRATRKTMIKVAFLLPVVFTATLVQAEPYVPKDGGQVLETLRSTAFDPVEHEIRALRARLTADPGNLTLACEFARRCIERS